MQKFAVLVEGLGCTGIVFRREDGTTYRPQGFYATRFVEAPHSSAAGETVLRLIEQELIQLDRTSHPSCRLGIAEVTVDTDAFDRYAPGQGFTWFTE
jgi:hypothetical protein